MHAAGIPLLRFGYDAAAPLGYIDHGRVPGHPGLITVHDVSFRSQAGLVQGYLLVPPGRERQPAVVFVHGSGGDRRELLAQAAWLAARNVVTLTITEPSTSSPPAPAPGGAAATLRQIRDLQVRNVVAIRRAVDLLQSLPEVDPHRIGYLGWSAGAEADSTFVGCIGPSGQGPRSPLSRRRVTRSPHSLRRRRPGLRAAVRQDLGSIDPIRYVAKARPGSVLLEDGTKDEIVPHTALLNIVHAAPHGTTVHWYAAPPALNRAAYHDAFDWFARKLPIDGPKVDGAATESGGG